MIHYLEQNKLPLTTSLYISQTEEDMHRDLRLCYQNWTSPLDAAKLLDLFVSNGKPNMEKFPTFA